MATPGALRRSASPAPLCRAWPACAATSTAWMAPCKRGHVAFMCVCVHARTCMCVHACRPVARTPEGRLSPSMFNPAPRGASTGLSLPALVKVGRFFAQRLFPQRLFAQLPGQGGAPFSLAPPYGIVPTCSVGAGLCCAAPHRNPQHSTAWHSTERPAWARTCLVKVAENSVCTQLICQILRQFAKV